MKTKLKQSITALIIFILLSLTFSSTLALQEFTLEYDANGNTIKDNFYTYEYNSFNQLKKVYNSAGQLIEEYKYDENSERILKKEYFNGETQTTYYVSKDFIRVVNSTGSYDFVYYYDDRGNLLGRKDPDGKKYFYHPDHLGSTSIVTDEEGNVVEETSYTPFGALLTGGKSKFLYTGKEKDMTGLYYYGARYYNANFGRFTQPDTIIPDVYDPQSLNRYSYVRNNPYKYVDPTGHFFDAVVDVGFILWDIGKLIFKGGGTDNENWKVLGLDFVGLATPFATGLGKAYKVGKLVDKTLDVSKGVGKIGDITKLNKNAKLLKKEGTVAVNSFKEADKLLGIAAQNSKKIGGAGTKSYTKFKNQAQMEKKLLEKGNTVYHKDYIFDKNTEMIYGHDEANKHAFFPHINIKYPDGTKSTIIIKKEP